MQRIRVFITAFLFSATLLLAADATRNVSIDEFDQLRTNASHVVLDVRTEKEFKAGHIPGATLIDFNAPGFDEKLAKLDRSKTYLVHCAAGVRSAKACKKLEAGGFTNILHLSSGFQGWKKAGKPIEK